MKQVESGKVSEEVLRTIRDLLSQLIDRVSLSSTLTGYPAVAAAIAKGPGPITVKVMGFASVISDDRILQLLRKAIEILEKYGESTS